MKYCNTAIAIYIYIVRTCTIHMRAHTCMYMAYVHVHYMYLRYIIYTYVCRLAGKLYRETNDTMCICVYYSTYNQLRLYLKLNSLPNRKSTSYVPFTT